MVVPPPSVGKNCSVAVQMESLLRKMKMERDVRRLQLRNLLARHPSLAAARTIFYPPEVPNSKAVPKISRTYPQPPLHLKPLNPKKTALPASSDVVRMEIRPTRPHWSIVRGLISRTAAPLRGAVVRIATKLLWPKTSAKDASLPVPSHLMAAVMIM